MVGLILHKLAITAHDKSYEVIFNNNFKSLIQIINKLTENNGFIIIDQKVDRIYSFSKLLKCKNKTIISSSESIKSLNFSKNLILNLKKNNINKNSKIVAIGGGTLQDVTQFSASILYRGIDYIFVPTTLQAISDSCIGSKTSINLSSFKNQIGTFYSPKKVLIFPEFIDSLDENNLKSGIAELLKLLIIGNFNKLDEVYDELMHRNMNSKKLTPYVFKALEVKKSFIELDEYDKGLRKILNYGHTFAHSIETATNNRISHGNATAIGINMANYFSLKNNFVTKQWFNFHFNFFDKYYSFEKLFKRFDLNGKSIVNNFKHDKKLLNDRIIELILPHKKEIKIKKVLMDRELINTVDEFLYKFN